MKNILKEEINQIKYLFNYDRGKILSEQIDPEKIDEYKVKFVFAKFMKKDDEAKKYQDAISNNTELKSAENSEIVSYYNKSSEEDRKNYLSKFESFGGVNPSTPTLPKAEPTTDLGSAPSELFTYINGRKELNTAFLEGTGEEGKWVGKEVKEWCKENATEGSVCVLGKSINKNMAQNTKLPLSVDAAKKDLYVKQKISPTYIGDFEESSGDGEKQIKIYYGAVYSKS
jgi:hypothetical protein